MKTLKEQMNLSPSFNWDSTGMSEQDMILSVRDQNTFEEALRKKRLMSLIHLYLVHRYKADSVHYVTPTEDNQYQTERMKAQGLFTDVNTEVGQIIVANVNAPRIAELLAPGRAQLVKLIKKE